MPLGEWPLVPQILVLEASLTQRNVKNVAEDLGLLVSLGLVEMENRAGIGRKKAPRVEYETLTVEVHL
jgi:predicted transcriptional regulator